MGEVLIIGKNIWTTCMKNPTLRVACHTCSQLMMRTYHYPIIISKIIFRKKSTRTYGSFKGKVADASLMTETARALQTTITARKNKIVFAIFEEVQEVLVGVIPVTARPSTQKQ